MWIDLQNSFTVRFLEKFCTVYTYRKDSHLTLNMTLHYPVKLENYNCCQFQWYVVCEASEFILQEMRLP